MTGNAHDAALVCHLGNPVQDGLTVVRKGQGLGLMPMLGRCDRCRHSVISENVQPHQAGQEG